MHDKSPLLEKSPKIKARISPSLRDKLALCQMHPDQVLFLDIETTGLSHYYDEITVVGWSYGGAAKTFIKGEDHSLLLNDAASAVAIVTFNGIRFDQRFLLQEFADVRLPKVHIDLMYLCRRIGLTGGQKSIEKELGLNFRDELEDVDGLAAVLLWHRYLRGDLKALSKLIRYNRADIAAMGAILDASLLRLEIEPDFFAKTVEFKKWSAPKGWRKPPRDLRPASTELTKAPVFFELFKDKQVAKSRVVGIDLTGSEARATGWCLLDGNKAETTLISTDEEIVSRTLMAKPDIVSIDSPLCLPAGRLSVEDTDPGRNKYGIMRECERLLKRRGVNVYPSLLPSMQKLTARGIELARRFRNEGLPVIESYPGAAQDIMRIPRKGAGIEWLKMGLEAFGIVGKFNSEDVSHDELDAITSALVGMFHLAGLSEAIGTEKEPPMIIPDLKANGRPFVVGISGPIAAGKTTVARMLEEKSFAYTRFSLVIDEKLKKQGLELNRQNRQMKGAEINQAGNQRMLASLTINRVKDAKYIVVDGMRFPDDHAYFVEMYGKHFIHIYVYADEHIRSARYNKREVDRKFADAEKSSVEQSVFKLQLLADIHINNNADLNSLEKRIKELVTSVGEDESCLFL